MHSRTSTSIPPTSNKLKQDFIVVFRSSKTGSREVNHRNPVRRQDAAEQGFVQEAIVHCSHVGSLRNVDSDRLDVSITCTYRHTQS